MKNYLSDYKSKNKRASKNYTMHDAVCGKCGNDCKVPFKPSGEKPVFCSNCFEKENTHSGGNSHGKRGTRRDYSSRNTGGSYRSNNNDKRISQLGEKLDALGTKLDTIINLLSAKDVK